MKCTECGKPIENDGVFSWCQDCYEAKYDEDLSNVIDLIRRNYGETIVDYNVVDDDRVELLDKDDNVVHVINTDRLTALWNAVE